MASNSTCRDPNTTSMSTTTVATSLTSDPTNASVVAAATVASSARPIASVQKLQPIPQPRIPQFAQQHPQRHHPFQHHQYMNATNHQHQPGVFTAPTSIQTQTHMHPHLAKVSEPIRYPLVSSGRGVLPTHRGIRPQQPEQVANSGAYPPMASSIVPNSCTQQYQQQNSRLAAPADSSHPGFHVRGPFVHPSHALMPPGSVSTAVRGVPLNNPPQSKASSSPYFASESNASKDPIDKGTEDTLVTLRDRKVRITEGASFYALCRSWLRNGYVEENQPQYGDGFKSLPKPLPLPETFSPKRKEHGDETEAEEAEKALDGEEESIDARDLLTMHVKRAKRVRARLREEREHRIERYKSRLGLLLHPNGTMQD